jgi:hypothetical protein
MLSATVVVAISKHDAMLLLGLLPSTIGLFTVFAATMHHRSKHTVNMASRHRGNIDLL